MNLLDVRSLSKSFDNGKTFVLDNVSFSISKGKVTTIVGESGSAKTTLIRLIAGLETPDAGSITLKNEIISSNEVLKSPEKRNIGLVFQDYALFPHLTVEKNIAYGILDKSQKDKRIKEVLSLVGLTGYEKRYPHQLSGGQQQRVALARALAPNPELLILDEPFSNLDTMLREQLRREIFEIIKETKVTAIFVTHDTEDALAVSDEIMVMKQGKLMQKDTSEILYKQPKSLYVASLFGSITELTPEILEAFNYTYEASKKYAIRIHDLKINKKENHYQVDASLERSEFMGSTYHVTVKVLNQHIVRLHSSQTVNERNVKIGFDDKDILTFE